MGFKASGFLLIMFVGLNSDVSSVQITLLDSMKMNSCLIISLVPVLLENQLAVG